MQNDNNPQVPSFLPDDVKGITEDDKEQMAVAQPPQTTLSTRKVVIQPSAAFVQEMQSQAQTGSLAPGTPAAPPPQPVLPPPQPSVPVQPGPVPGAAPPAESQPSLIGLSGSQIEQSTVRHGHSWLRGLRSILTPIIVLLLLGGGFWFYKYYWHGYTTKTVQAADFSYRISFSRTAKEVALSNLRYLQGDDKSGHTMLAIVVKSTKTYQDCGAESGGSVQVQVVDKVTVDGKPYSLCYLPASNIYGMGFAYHNVWYIFSAFPKDKTQVLNQDSVKQVAHSVQIL